MPETKIKLLIKYLLSLLYILSNIESPSNARFSEFNLMNFGRIRQESAYQKLLFKDIII